MNVRDNDEQVENDLNEDYACEIVLSCLLLREKHCYRDKQFTVRNKMETIIPQK